MALASVDTIVPLLIPLVTISLATLVVLNPASDNSRAMVAGSAPVDANSCASCDNPPSPVCAVRASNSSIPLNCSGVGVGNPAAVNFSGVNVPCAAETVNANMAIAPTALITSVHFHGPC